MAKETRIHAILAEGRCTLTIGRTLDAAIMALEEPRLVKHLLECLWDEDPGVAGRAADALETVSTERPGTLQPWKDELLGLIVEARAIKLRWHLALLVVRLKLTRPECRRVADTLSGWLDDRSSIVKTCAMQGLAELTLQDPENKDGVLDLLRALTRSGTPAMRARGRALIEQMEKGKAPSWNRVKQKERAALNPARSSLKMPQRAQQS
jgi:hypothetical protein